MNARDEEMAILAPALSLPEDRSDWAAWLEKQLIGLNLAKLCKQLVTLGGIHPPKSTLEEVLGDRRALVMQFGLQNQLSVQQLQQLLSQPALLLDLQTLILDQGGDYWMRVEPEPSTSAALDAARNKVMSSIRVSPDRKKPIDQAIADATDNAREGGNQPTVRRSEDPGQGQGTSWYWLGALLATAAAILIVVMNPFKKEDQGEFFAAAELRIPSATLEKTLERMASRIESDWGKIPLSDNAKLVSRLVVFRDSCDQLIDGKLDEALRGLSEGKLLDLKERCKKWKERASTMITEFEALGPEQNVDENRKRAGELMDRLIGILRNPDELDKPKPV